LQRFCHFFATIVHQQHTISVTRTAQLHAYSEPEGRDYILDHKVYSHSAITDLEKVYPGITQGVWDETTDKRKWIIRVNDEDKLEFGEEVARIAKDAQRVLPSEIRHSILQVTHAGS
jgi:hypothetical protein